MELSLDSSGALEDSLLQFINKLLKAERAGTIAPSGITAFEVKLWRARKEVDKLDRSLSKGIDQTLRSVKHLIPVAVTLQFLLYSQQKGQLEQAEEILYVVERDGFTIDRESLGRILRDSKDVPLDWALTLNGFSATLRDEILSPGPPLKLPKSLD